MNYYEHHIGDYDSATAHLSLLEDAVYRRLICLYYRTETALPGEVKAVCRLVRAASKAERDTVAEVLAEFFELRDGAWHNDRCDAEIARFQDKQAKARRSAEARWGASKPQSEGNANAYADASADAMRTHSEGNAPRARPQSPDTRHQTQIPGNSPRSAESPPAPWTPAAGVCLTVRKAGLAQCNPSDPRCWRCWSAAPPKRSSSLPCRRRSASAAAGPTSSPWSRASSPTPRSWLRGRVHRLASSHRHGHRPPPKPGDSETPTSLPS